jgi:hypothetical protein
MNKLSDKLYELFYFIRDEVLWDSWYKIARFINKLSLYVAYITRDDKTRNRYE